MQATKQLDFTEFTEKVGHLISPITKDSPITFFAHLRKYKNGNISLLSNHFEWYHHCLEREYTILHETLCNAKQLPSQYSVWMAEKQSSAMRVIYQELRVIFNIENGITITEPNEAGYCDYFLLASDKNDTSVFNYYFNEMTAIKAFIKDYRLQADNWIQEADSYRSFDPKQAATKLKQEKRIHSVTRKHPLLSKRELECALHCKEGRTAKETAKILNLSRRTVEYYLEKVKIKLNCNSKYQLITKLYEKDIAQTSVL